MDSLDAKQTTLDGQGDGRSWAQRRRGARPTLVVRMRRSPAPPARATLANRFSIAATAGGSLIRVTREVILPSFLSLLPLTYRCSGACRGASVEAGRLGRPTPTLRPGFRRLAHGLWDTLRVAQSHLWQRQRRRESSAPARRVCRVGGHQRAVQGRGQCGLQGQVAALAAITAAANRRRRPPAVAATAHAFPSHPLILQTSTMRWRSSCTARR